MNELVDKYIKFY